MERIDTRAQASRRNRMDMGSMRRRSSRTQGSELGTLHAPSSGDHPQAADGAPRAPREETLRIVEKQNPTVGDGHLTRAQRVSTADHARRADRMMRCPEGARRDGGRRFALDNRANAQDLEQLCPSSGGISDGSARAKSVFMPVPGGQPATDCGRRSAQSQRLVSLEPAPEAPPKTDRLFDGERFRFGRRSWTYRPVFSQVSADLRSGAAITSSPWIRPASRAF